MMSTRRTFLKNSAGIAAVAAVAPHPLLAQFGGQAPEPIPPIQDPRIKTLVQRALDAARSAGATYADVRLTYSRRRTVTSRVYLDGELLAAGVRALVNGYWGFASSPLWSDDEMHRLGVEAVHQAKVNSIGRARAVALAPVVAVKDGHWESKIKLNPFEIHPSEILDKLSSLEVFLSRFPDVSTNNNEAHFVVHDKAFGSTDNSYCTQRIFRSEGRFQFILRDERRQRDGAGEIDGLWPTSSGWELYADQPLTEKIREGIDEIQFDLTLPVTAVDVGHYDIVLDGLSVARLASTTIGTATQLDRVMGYEANAGGTSYIGTPTEKMIGSFVMGAPMLNVTGNRGLIGGAATVGWDDEGVVPRDFQIVKDGILDGFATTRESAGWLAPAQQSRSSAQLSQGCAYAPSGIEVPLAHTPNLQIAPGAENATYDSMIGTLKKGIAFKRLRYNIDFQGASGISIGKAYEIKDGKRIVLLSKTGILFRAPEIWKNLHALGGRGSMERYGLESDKGEPSQIGAHTVLAPPAIFNDATVIDTWRKA